MRIHDKVSKKTNKVSRELIFVTIGTYPKNPDAWVIIGSINGMGVNNMYPSGIKYNKRSNKIVPKMIKNLYKN